MSNKITGNKQPTETLLDVLMLLHKKVLKDINTAEVAVVTRIENDEIYVKLINSNSNILTCIKKYDLEVLQNDVVLVTFTGDDFRVNLERIKNGLTVQEFVTENRYNRLYGIVTDVVYRNI